MPTKDKVLLIRLNIPNRAQIKQPFHCTPPFPLKYIESLLNKENLEDVKFLDALAKKMEAKEIISFINNWKPKFIIIVVNNTTFAEFDDFLKKLNEKIFLIIIGQLPTDYDNDKIDIFLPGEADIETFNILKRLITGESREDEEIKKYRFFKKNPYNYVLSDNLDDMPFPNYSNSEIEDYQFLYPIRTNQKLIWGHILSSRGCPYECIFCSPVTRESYGKLLRVRSAQNIVDEMENLMHRGINIISFDDDNFTTDKTQAMNVCNEILQRNLHIKWIIHARIDNIDLSLLKLLKKAGCVHIRFGVESGSDRIIKELRKNKTCLNWTKQTQKVFQMTKELKISTTALVIIGNPSETREDILLTVKLVKKILPDVLQVHFFTPYQASSINSQAQYQSTQLMRLFHYQAPHHSLSKLSSAELKAFRTKLYRTLLLNPKFLFNHMYLYFSFYLHNSHILLKLLKGYLL